MRAIWRGNLLNPRRSGSEGRDRSGSADDERLPGERSAAVAPARGATAAIAGVAIAVAAGMALTVGRSDLVDDPDVIVVLAAVVGLSFVGTGLYAWRRRPESRYGVLMVLIGFAWLVPGLTAVESPVIFTLGLLLGSVWPAVLIQLLLSSFPSGRLTTAWARRLTAAAYILFLLALVPVLLLGDTETIAECDGPCPDNALQVADAADLVDALLGMVSVLVAVLCAAGLVVLVLRWRRAGPARRRALGPIYASALCCWPRPPRCWRPAPT